MLLITGRMYLMKLPKVKLDYSVFLCCCSFSFLNKQYMPFIMHLTCYNYEFDNIKTHERIYNF